MKNFSLGLATIILLCVLTGFILLIGILFLVIKIIFWKENKKQEEINLKNNESEFDKTDFDI